MSASVKSGEKINAAYGSWKSPISSDLVSCSDKHLGGIAVDSLGRLLWLESRPNEAGYVFSIGQEMNVKLKFDGFFF